MTETSKQLVQQSLGGRGVPRMRRSLLKSALLCQVMVKGLWNDRRVVFTPLCLTWCLMILLAVACQDLPQRFYAHMLVAQCLVAVLVALSWFLMKVFYGLQHGGAYDHLRLVPVGTFTLFLTHTFICWAFGFLALLGILGLGVLLAGGVGAVGGWGYVGVLAHSLLGFVVGLAPLGVLCSLLTARAVRESFVFPLIFYPLAIPLAIASLISLEVHLRPPELFVGYGSGMVWLFAFFYFFSAAALSSVAPE